MKTLLTTISAIALLTSSPLWAQSGPTPTAGRAGSKALAGQDAKEKDEDAALLRQLEVDAQQSRTEARSNKGQYLPNEGPRGAVNVTPFPGGGVSYQVQNVLTRPSPNSRALVIRTSDPDPKSETAMEEDLAVMSHLLTKSLEDLPGGPGAGNKVLGIDVFFTPDAAPLRSLYLDNYGAVFFLNVNFPLVEPPEKRPEPKPATDSAWEDARQELYGQRFGGNGGEPGEEYSQEKVDKLKSTLLEVLKNATNIRGLQPSEFVTIWVSGGHTGDAKRFRALRTNPPGTLGGNLAKISVGSSHTVLTIRVSKADVDAYASGKLPSEEFQKHARITAYNGGAPGAGIEGLSVGGFGGGRARF